MVARRVVLSDVEARAVDHTAAALVGEAVVGDRAGVLELLEDRGLVALCRYDVDQNMATMPQMLRQVLSELASPTYARKHLDAVVDEGSWSKLVFVHQRVSSVVVLRAPR